MARRFSIPASPNSSVISYNNFLGVDFTSDELAINPRRSPNAKNIINENGALRKRNGYKKVAVIENEHLHNKINGIYNYDTKVEDIIIVHAGTKLYKFNSNFENKQELASDLADNKSTAIILNGILNIFDGKRVILFGKFDDVLKIAYLDEQGYIPTTRINANPDGTGGETLDSINMIQEKRINTFLSNGTATEYKLDTQIINSADAVSVEKLNELGEWVVVNNYTVNHARATVVFNSAPSQSPVLGRDNIKITYKVRNEELRNLINKCRIVTAFGYGGNANRLFITGNGININQEYITEFDNPLYYPEDRITRIGLDSSAIQGYSRMSDGKLAVHKDMSDTDCTIYYHVSSMFNNQEAFPIISGTKGVGCISAESSKTLENDPMFLAQDGIYAIISNSNNSDEKYYALRSYYINSKLQKEINLKYATAVVYQGKYYLAVNKNIYVCDSRFTSYEKNSKTTAYQYEWYLWNDISVRVWFVFRNKLYFGDELGNIYVFTPNDFKDNGKDIEAMWETPYSNLNSFSNNKTIQRIAIALDPMSDTNLTIAYSSNKKNKELLYKSFGNIQKQIPKEIICKKKIKKVMFFKLIITSKEALDMNISSINIVYDVIGNFKGD